MSSKHIIRKYELMLIEFESIIDIMSRITLIYGFMRVIHFKSSVYSVDKIGVDKKYY